MDVNHLVRHARQCSLQRMMMLRANLDHMMFLLALDRHPMEGLIGARCRPELHKIGIG